MSCGSSSPLRRRSRGRVHRRRPATTLVIAPPAVLDALARPARSAARGCRSARSASASPSAARRAAPDIGSVEALKQRLLAADSVVFNRASTGLYVETLLVSLGLADAVNAKATRHPDGASVIKHLLASRLPREFGFGAITEIVLFKDQGLRLVGPLPAGGAEPHHYLASAAAAPPADAAPRRRGRGAPALPRAARRRAASSPRSASSRRPLALASPFTAATHRRTRHEPRPSPPTCAIRRSTATRSSSSPTTTSGP